MTPRSTSPSAPSTSIFTTSGASTTAPDAPTMAAPVRTVTRSDPCPKACIFEV